MARLTYGLGWRSHPLEECSSRGCEIVPNHKGVLLCKNRFAPLVREGDVVRLGEKTPPVTAIPTQGASTCVLPIYSTTNPAATHTTDAGMVRIGEVEVEVKMQSSTQTCDDYDIETCFKFGTTEMEVCVMDVTHKKPYAARVNFHGDMDSRAVIAGM